MKDELFHLKAEAIAQITSASSEKELDRLRLRYLGRKGTVSQLASRLPFLPPDQKRDLGKTFNDIKIAIVTALNSRQSDLKQPAATSANLDLTLPGIKPPRGHLHPITSAIEEISAIFERLGFTRVRHPEVDWDWYAFESLNMPKGHPARDEWETFFIDAPAHPTLGNIILTPHTSSGQVREMERLGKPPIRMINIAKCHRRQSDLTHTVMFHQFEGLVVDKDINISHLKGTIDYFAKNFFGPDRSTRLRPYHFQFTEPSFEVDISCDICQAQGCKLCKDGWLELGGAGIVHPAVLKNGGIDPEKYTGFALGMGVERTYMMKSGLKIPDIRLLYSNDIRFLNQF